ncbi:MAG: SprT family zinc-dependent metalloprotease, partial [Pseudomonadota bacterium]
SKRLLPQAAAFAEARIDWLAAQLERKCPAQPLEEGSLFPLRGSPCHLTAKGPGRLPTLLEGPPLTLCLPGAPETLSARAIRYFKRAAKADLEAAVARHTSTLGVEVRRIRVKDTRSRWGSCTHDGNLSFSWRLIFAEPYVLDYVAAHECAHLIEMNHSAAFWKTVERTCPGWQTARDWLKTEGQSLHAIGAE